MFYLSHSSQETKKFAIEFALKLSMGTVVALEGDLGSGKTTFVQGLAEGFGIKDIVRSPSFTLMNIYPFQSVDSEKHYFVHVDAYRLDSAAKLEETGLDEWIGRKDAIIFIEWPERFELPIAFDWKIVFAYGDEEETREILIRHLLSHKDSYPT
ncbi:tRNA (adenosine(37)-N6)-threonylcarbamoyltransferase complex ATPase subunit type 1 TsaE [Candidatus Uhrbacteria bacterium CG_4_9_14_3_um_filter_36_7]|uniref:tRNA threonylcarbamoyladenosine biosynthesis protein TsaE n=1 Tax=Candidatus Uhrbacteria bacterium CG_4_9_14_3_um_filter_36_7 TaxID=1975033 RepID=A0A2M7XHD5_9BACT|nr:MAG: tRNA (adenosine(37)-N6)-threonylcarbamoyltransferase complex ATPase subunit type 1 TsaE [Candidatus Uhrbacteria bacterium CG_4_9_14_3_um_filter_36_7]